jgi:hypothetical protein
MTGGFKAEEGGGRRHVPGKENENTVNLAFKFKVLEKKKEEEEERKRNSSPVGSLK